MECGHEEVENRRQKSEHIRAEEKKKKSEGKKGSTQSRHIFSNFSSLKHFVLFESECILLFTVRKSLAVHRRSILATLIRRTTLNSKHKDSRKLRFELPVNLERVVVSNLLADVLFRLKFSISQELRSFFSEGESPVYDNKRNSKYIMSHCTTLGSPCHIL